jgi:cytochrome c oxidase assembly protein subunit 15
VQDLQHHHRLHVSAWLVALFTFPLIFIGGLVTSKGVGLAVPDWPNSFGYNMWFFPPGKWVGGVFYEHVHRLKGTVVGFLAIVLCLQAWGPAANPFLRKLFAGIAGTMLGIAVLLGLSLFTLSGAAHTTMQHTVSGFASLGLIAAAAWFAPRRDGRASVRWLCTAVLVAVIIQGTLGGLRVTELSLTLAIVHGCFAQAFFALTVLVIVITSRWWQSAPDHSTRDHSTHAADGRRLYRWMVAAVAVIYLQLVVGAIMRHHQAGLAIPDLPLHYGQLVPPASQAGLDAANAWRATLTPPLGPVTLEQVWMHASHRIGAIVVSAVLIVAGVRTLRGSRPDGLKPLAVAMLILLAVQFTLGVLTVWLRKPADIASTHVAVGAVLLVTTFALAVRVWRVYVQQRRPVGGFEPVVPPASVSPSALVAGRPAG